MLRFDFWMKLTPSFTTTSVLSITICQLLFGSKRIVLSQKSHLHHDLTNQVFFEGDGFFIDAFVYDVRHQHRICSSSGPSKHRESWKLCRLNERRIGFMTAVASAHAHACQTTCLTTTHACFSAPELPVAEAHNQISAFSQRSY